MSTYRSRLLTGSDGWSAPGNEKGLRQAECLAECHSGHRIGRCPYLPNTANESEIPIQPPAIVTSHDRRQTGVA